jgi:hypothetical protein
MGVCTGGAAGNISLRASTSTRSSSATNSGCRAPSRTPGIAPARLHGASGADKASERVLASAFANSAAHVRIFDNAFWDRDASNTVYNGVKASLS